MIRFYSSDNVPDHNIDKIDYNDNNDDNDDIGENDNADW